MSGDRPQADDDRRAGGGIDARDVRPTVSPAAGSEPLWRDEVAISAADERYVTRRQFGKFLVLTSLAMLAGNVWILVRSLLFKEQRYPEVQIAGVDELSAGQAKLFHYPDRNSPCLLLRLDDGTHVAYSQKCTHLSCAVYYSPKAQELECPCHEGSFSARTGRVIKGPPPRPLPRVRLERRGDRLYAVELLHGALEGEPIFTGSRR